MITDHPRGGPGAPTSDRALLGEPARQSPLAFVFIGWRFVRRLGFSALAAAFLFVANGGVAVGFLTIAAILGTVLLVVSAMSWWRFTFSIEGDELVVTRGIVTIDRLVIPLDRVQSVSIDQRLFHRPLGLVRVGIDTAGSAGTELEIDALDRGRADALRRVVTDVRDGEPVADPTTDRADVDEGVVLIRRTPAELVRIGAAKLPLAGLAVLAPLAAFGDEIGALSVVGERLDRSADQLGDLQERSVVALVSVVVALVIAALVLLVVLRILRELIVHWDLTLRRTPTGLRRTAGLLNTTSRSTTLRRVQIVTTDDWWVQRRLGITDLTLRAFGRTNLDLPGAEPGEVTAIRALVVGPDDHPALDRTISGWSVFVALRTRTFVVAAVAAVGWLAVGWWSLLALAAVPLSVPTTVARWRRRRWGLDRHSLVERYGIVWQHTGELAVHKAQVVTVRQSFFERRRGLATLEVSTAGGSISVPFIGLAEATAARDVVLHRAETDRRPVL